MTVRITKPQVDINKKITELDKPSGIAGETLLRSETLREQQNILGVGRRNLIINGDFKIWQRGTSFSSPSGDQYTADRWFNGSADDAVWSKQTETLPNGVKAKTMRIQYNTNAAAYVDPYQGIEDYESISGQVVTFSAWVRTTLPGVTFRQYSTGSIGKIIPNDGDWHYITATVRLPSITSTTRGVNSPYFGLSTNATIAHYSGDFLEFTQFQLELGSAATPFEHRSYGEELSLCQRYFQILSTDNYPYSHLYLLKGYLYESHMYFFEKEMRAPPTIGFNASNLSLKDWNTKANIAFSGLGIVTDKKAFYLNSTTTNNNEKYEWLILLPITIDAEL